MLDSNQNIRADNDGKAAGRDVNDNSTNILFIMPESKAASSIQIVLLKISEFTTDVKYEKPDTKEYTIEHKIDHNSLSKYRKYFERLYGEL
jgi:hypothetical protein